MQTFPIFFCLFIVPVLINPVKIDRLEKKSKGKGAKSRSEVEEMFEEIGRGREKVKNKEGNGLRLKNEFRDRSGNKITRVEQEYDGLRVFGYHIIQREIQGKEIAERDRKTRKKTGRIKKIEKGKKLNGNFASELSTDLGEIDKTKLNPNEALEKLKTRYNNPITSNDLAESVIYIDQTTGQAQIAYEVGFFIEQSNELSSPIALYSQDGKIIKEWNNVQSSGVVKKGTGPGGNPKLGRFEYGQTEPFLDVYDYGNGSCEHFNGKVFVFDMKNQPRGFQSSSVIYDCYNQNSDNPTNRAYSPFNDALYYGTLVYDWYWYEYAEKPFEGIGVLALYVHLGPNVVNAFYIGSGILYFGDGDPDHYPFVTMDIVAHEIGHGVTQKTSGLIYIGESGGLNEAFSDMAAAAGEAFMRYKQLTYWEKEESYNWEYGDEVVVAVNGKFRCLDNPPCDGVSLDHVNQFDPPNPPVTNGTDVHHSSGIFNKVFYLLAKGFKFGIRDAFDLFYICNTRKWGPDTNFTEAAESTLETAEEIVFDGDHLVGNYYYINITFIQETFKEVGINCWKDSGDDWKCDKML